MASHLTLHSILLSSILFSFVLVSGHHVYKRNQAAEEDNFGYPVFEGIGSNDDLLEGNWGNSYGREGAHGIMRRDTSWKPQKNGCRTLTSRERNLVMGLGPCKSVGSFPLRNECTVFLQCVQPGTHATLNCCPVGLFFDHDLRRCIFITEARCIETHQNQIHQTNQYADDGLDEGEFGSYEKVVRRRQLVLPSAPSPEWKFYPASTPPDQFPSAYWNQGSSVAQPPPEGVHYFAIPVVVSFVRLPQKSQEDTGNQAQKQLSTEGDTSPKENLNMMTLPPLPDPSKSSNVPDDSEYYEYEEGSVVDWYPQFDENSVGTESKNLTSGKTQLTQMPTTIKVPLLSQSSNLKSDSNMRSQNIKRNVVGSTPNLFSLLRSGPENELVDQSTQSVNPTYPSVDESYDSDYDTVESEDNTIRATNLPGSITLPILPDLQPVLQMEQQDSTTRKHIEYKVPPGVSATVEGKESTRATYPLPSAFDESFESYDDSIKSDRKINTKRSTDLPVALPVPAPPILEPLLPSEQNTSTSKRIDFQLPQVDSESVEENKPVLTKVSPHVIISLEKTTPKSLDKPEILVLVVNTTTNFHENGSSRHIDRVTTEETTEITSSTLRYVSTMTPSTSTGYRKGNQVAVIVSRDASESFTLRDIDISTSLAPFTSTSTTTASTSSSVAPPLPSTSTEVEPTVPSTSLPPPLPPTKPDEVPIVFVNFSSATIKPTIDKTEIPRESGLPLLLDAKPAKINVNVSETNEPQMMATQQLSTTQKPSFTTEWTTITTQTLDDWVPDLGESGETSTTAKRARSLPIRKGNSTDGVRRKRRVLRKRRKPKNKVAVKNS